MAGIAIGFINQKGGVLKTTLSTMFATSIFYGSKNTVGLLDADIQNSASNTREVERFLLTFSPKLGRRFKLQSEVSQRKTVYPIKSSRMDTLEVLEDLPKFKNQYNITLVDVPGTFYIKDYLKIMKEIEFIIIPVHTEDKTQTASLELLQLIDYIKTTEADCKIKGVAIAFVKYSKNNAAHFDELREYFTARNIHVFENVIKESKRFENYTSPKFKDIFNKYVENGRGAEGISALNEEDKEYLEFMAEKENLASTLISFPSLSKNADISPVPLFTEILSFIKTTMQKK